MSLDAYALKQLRKNKRFACRYCLIDLSEEHNACCGEAGHGEWMDACGHCEDIISPHEEGFERDRGRYYVCKPCHESGDA